MSLCLFVCLQEVRDRQNLRKCYFLFISSVAANNVADVIASQGVCVCVCVCACVCVCVYACCCSIYSKVYSTTDKVFYICSCFPVTS